MTGSRETKKQAIRESIYKTAIALFETHGYDAVSVGRITAQVGIAKGTFFNHYPTKADILARWYSDAANAALAAPDPNLGLLDRLIALNLQTGEIMRTQPELWRAKNAEAGRSALLQQAERGADQRYLEAVIAQLQSSSLGESKADLAALADIILAISTGTWREALVTARSDEAEALLRARLRHLLVTLGVADDAGPQ